MEGVSVWLPNFRIIRFHSAEGNKRVPVVHQPLVSQERDTGSIQLPTGPARGCGVGGGVELQKYLTKLFCLREKTKMTFNP